jgi:hypothetical protein
MPQLVVLHEEEVDSSDSSSGIDSSLGSDLDSSSSVGGYGLGQTVTIGLSDPEVQPRQKVVLRTVRNIRLGAPPVVRLPYCDE